MAALQKKYIRTIDKELVRLGVQGENKATSILINIEDWIALCPDPIISVLMQTPCGKIQLGKSSFYGSSILWEITSADTREAGIGTVQFTLKNKDGVTVKSKVARYIVSPSIDCKNPIDPYVPAESAFKLAEAREISLIGNVQGSTSFDGSKDVQIQTVISTLSNEEMEEMLK